MIKMPNLVKLFKKDPICNMVLVMLSIFIVMPIHVPSEIAKLVDTSLGVIFIIIMSVYLLCRNPLMGIIVAIAGYELVKRSRGSGGIVRGFSKNYIPGEKNKYKKMKTINNFPYTVEELVINSTIPYSYNTTDDAKYEDSANDTHLAEKV